MKCRLKRIASLLLAVVICVTTIPIESFAATAGGGEGIASDVSSGGSNPTTAGYGVRLTVGTSDQLSHIGGLQPLSASCTKDEMVAQFKTIAELSRRTYVRPGNGGIYFTKGDNQTSTGVWDSVTTELGKSARFVMNNTVADGFTNQLAWMIYNPAWMTTRPGGDASPNRGYAFSTEIFNCFKNAAQYSTYREWSDNIKALYIANGGASPVNVISQAVSEPERFPSSWRAFSWAEYNPYAGGSAPSPYEEVVWSQLGHMTSIMYLAWAAQEVGDEPTYEDMMSKLYSWAITGYQGGDSQPMVMAEMTSTVFINGRPVNMTMPVQVAIVYPNFSPAQLYGDWGAEYDSSTTAIANMLGNTMYKDNNLRSQLKQGFGGFWRNGAFEPNTKTSYASRQYFTKLYPISSNHNNFGYFHNWTYFSESDPFDSNPPPSNTADGSFTWKLNPNGVKDKTPDEQINAPSTITDLNIAQNGYNKNNYNKWETRVRSDGKDCNKVKVSIYHIEEPLAAEKESTVYTREQVKAKGKLVTEPLERVTIGNGIIQNVPEIGSLQNAKESQNLTDDQFLNILKTATGLTYTETITGPIVDVNGETKTPRGIRVTYAVFVDVSVGCTRWEPFSNEQAEYIEYRSEPGTYTFISDDPQGYAEIKCGYFNGEEGYSEPYEAMAGTPTTENLYFVSGGQEFVAQIKYQYTTDKDAIRSFEQKYEAKDCEGYWTPVTKTFTNASTEEVQNWLNTWTGATHTSGEFITAKACTQCGVIHQNGTGKEAIQKTSIDPVNGKEVYSQPATLTIGPYYSEVDLKGVAWDWTQDSHSEAEEKDDETGEVTHEACEHDSQSVSDSAAFTPNKCDHGTSAKYGITKTTKWSGTVTSYHVDFNENKAHKQNQASIKWEQHYNDMNYAKIKEAHVWRLEKSRMEGLRQITFKQEDHVLAAAEKLANVIFNVAKADNAKEGRMFYALHPDNQDAFVFKETLKTRGCCTCFNHNAAEDLISSKENPNNMYEDAWCISDYLILQGFNATTSLLYHEYQTLNAKNNDKPILKIRVSGTDQTSRQDNSYFVYEGNIDAQGNPTEQELERGYDKRGTNFVSQVISFNTYANATDGTMEKICENSETFVPKVDSDDISWAGFRGFDGDQGVTREQAQAGVNPGALDQVGKYQGIGGVTNFNQTSKAGSTKVDGVTTSKKKIFLNGYAHEKDGEVDGFSTSNPQAYEDLDNPFILAVNDIDVHDVKVPNGEKKFKNSTIFYHNIISWKGGALWDETTDQTYNARGFKRKTNYSDKHKGINEIIIHNPVSAQFAKLIPLSSELDQRVDTNLIIDSLNQDTDKCPGKANACKYAHLNCNYRGDRYHTADCYVETRSAGLATLPVKGNVTTEMKPIKTTKQESGNLQFGYTGSRQTFVAPATGRYHFNVYGAQGGVSTSGGSGGYGGYAYGDVYLTKGQIVFIYVGGMGGTGYNSGGYNGGGGGSNNGGGGGGMSSISVDPNSAAAPSNNRDSGARGYLCDGAACMSTGKHRPANCPYGHSCSGCRTCHTCADNGYFKPPVSLWNASAGYLLIAGGGGGSGAATGGNGGSGGGQSGEAGQQRCGTPGQGGTQTSGGAAGRSYATAGIAGCGGSGLTTSQSGGGGGGGGWFGGGGGGNDSPRYKDVDDSGGGGGSGYLNNYKNDAGENWVINAGWQNGKRSGNGLVEVSYDITVETTVMVPVTSGTYEYDKSQGDVIPVEMKPHIFTADTSGYYSVHLYGSVGGGAAPGQPSAGGKGGYAGGQIYLKAGQQILVTVGGVGANGATAKGSTEYEWVLSTDCGNYSRGPQWSVNQPSSGCSNHAYYKTGRTRGTGNISGGYNGGGNGGTTSGGGYGGGGATDIAINFVYQNAAKASTQAGSGILQNGVLDLTRSGAFYYGPRISSQKGHIYRVDYYGENLDKANYDSLAYTVNWNSNTLNNATLLHSYITPEHAQLFWRVDTPSIALGQEFRVHGNGVVKLKEVYCVDMNDRLMVAAGGGGADNAGGTLNGSDDGRGGNGGGADGENGYSNGVSHYENGGAKATSGYAQGIGESTPEATDAGGGGAGWYGGYKGNTGNSGGGGGSSNLGKMQNATTKAGQNSGAGYALFVKPGKGQAPMIHTLSCSEPHHAPNKNWHRYTDGWMHEGGFICTGVGCVHCAEGLKLNSPSGFTFTQANLNDRSYVIKHDGEYHLTDGNDNHCDQCGKDVVFEQYTLDGKNYTVCRWQTAKYDTAAYNTTGATNPIYHYAFGDDTCYDPCNDDEKHKKTKTEDNNATSPTRSGQFVVLDYDFQVYFPNIGDFYGNGAFGIGETQKPEGMGYTDEMDTTIWLREKYLQFPYDVTYQGKTYLAGEKVMLGVYDEATYTWTDDSPGDYKYTFHCLLNNNERASARVRYVAVAKNAPSPDTLENAVEDRNYTRYGTSKRAYHDAFKEYFIDVIGRIGVLSIEDTGDFRFSNYYKQVLEGWQVDQVVRAVDLGKQNFVSIDQKTIFNDPVSKGTKGQNTWGLTDWMEPIDKLRAFPLTPGENNVKALKNQAHRIGYSDYMSLVTVGNYYGENSVEHNNMYKVQIQPYYYYYNLETKEWVPVDVYIKDGDHYKSINKYGTSQATADYNFNYNLNWESEYLRRMYTKEEEDATKLVQENYTMLVDGEENSDTPTLRKIAIPYGIKYLHGTANMLFLRDGNRTFIGGRNRYGENTEQDGRISEVKFNRQAQRWNFTLGLPSTAAFVQKGESCTPENIAKYDMKKGVIICALDILAKGQVWTLHYDGVPVGERSFYLFDNNTTLVSWENAGTNGPQNKQVVVVYTDAKTSRDDLNTEGTH